MPSTVLGFLFVFLLAPFVSATGSYFSISEPATGRQWVNGAANPVQWSQGLLDGINVFDVELARMNKDGILYVARNVPKSMSAFNIFLNGVPSGNDYYMIFINSTHGVMYDISPQFTIVDSLSSSNGSISSPIQSAPTITVSGSPNPTAAFVTTYPATSDGVPLGWVGMGGWMRHSVMVLCGASAGAFLVFM